MFKTAISALALCASLVTAIPSTLAARAITPGSLQQVTDFPKAKNPTNVGFYIYVPKKLGTNPGIVVAIHYCTGSAQSYSSGSPYNSLSESNNFVVIYPSSPHSGTCWDVSSKATLTHNGGGDSNAIANFVTWTIDQYKADAKKVFVTGSSSGAMMTNVMAATYPELFQAGIAYSGVPAGCFVSTSGGVDAWNSSCANAQVHNTPQVWANVVFNMDPGYNGTRPKMQIYHGSTDATLLPGNYQETVKEWVGVFGYNYDKPESTKSDTPQSKYTTTVYGPMVSGIYATGVGHTVPIRGSDDMKFFGFTS